MDYAAKILQSVLVVLAGIGVWHIAMVWLKREAATRSFESWAEELYAVSHDLIDADMNVARCEARLMQLIGSVPVETSYQAIRRLGLGRQIEAAILLKLEALGVGERLPPDPATVETPPPAVATLPPASRRRV